MQPTPRLWHLGGISLVVSMLEVMLVRGARQCNPVVVHGDAHQPARLAKRPWVMFGLGIAVAVIGIGVQIFLVLANPIPIL